MDIAQKKAQEDWDNCRTRYLVNGCVSGNMPLFDKESGFYVATVENAEEFCDKYNQYTSILVRRYGYPDCAPVSRIPNRNIIFEILKKSIPISNYIPENIKEKRKFGFISRKLDQSVISWLKYNDILFLTSKVNDKCGRVDLIDLKEYIWMHKMEFLKKHVGNIPWFDIV